MSLSFIERSRRWLGTNPCPAELLKTYRALLTYTRTDATPEELEAVQELVMEAAIRVGVPIEDLIAIADSVTLDDPGPSAPQANLKGGLDLSPLGYTEQAPAPVLSSEDKRSAFEALKRNLMPTMQGAV